MYDRKNPEDIDRACEEHAVKALMYGLTRRKAWFKRVRVAFSHQAIAGCNRERQAGESSPLDYIISSLRRGEQKRQNLSHMKTTTSATRNSINHALYPLALLFLPLALASFALSPQARAACQQGCDLTN